MRANTIARHSRGAAYHEVVDANLLGFRPPVAEFLARVERAIGRALARLFFPSREVGSSGLSSVTALTLRISAHGLPLGQAAATRARNELRGARALSP